MITCPYCERTSHHPMDKRYGWCSACNGYTSDPSLLAMFVVYDHPSDVPDEFVARLHLSGSPTNFVLRSPTLQDLREHLALERGLACITRDSSDDPVIVESWL